MRNLEHLRAKTDQWKIVGRDRRMKGWMGFSKTHLKDSQAVKLWRTPGSLFMCPSVRRVSEPQLCLWALQAVLLTSRISPLLCWVPRPVRSGLDRCTPEKQGEHRGRPNGELDDPSLLFSLGDITSGISKYWVSLFIRILFALAHDARNTTLLTSFQFSSKSKPNLFFSPHFHHASDQTQP